MQIEVKITKSELEEIIRRQMGLSLDIKINVVLVGSEEESPVEETFTQDGYVWTRNRQMIAHHPDGLAADTEVEVIFNNGSRSIAVAGAWDTSWNAQRPDYRHITAYRVIE